MNRLIDLLGLELSAVSSKEKLIAALGGFISILLLILVSEHGLHLAHGTAIVASMGASAVLLFAVPHGQLSQPWPVIVGHTVPALIGVSCAKWISPPEVAAAAAVGLSIAAMQQFKCIHPPGGATALTAVLGGRAIHDSGYAFVLFPVLTNAVMIVAIGVIFNSAFKWRRYPAALMKRRSSVVSASPTHDEVVNAMRSLDSFVDITEDDLVTLVNLLAKKRM
jgi:CBS-domain-containing membrane protein